MMSDSASCGWNPCSGQTTCATLVVVHDCMVSPPYLSPEICRFTHIVRMHPAQSPNFAGQMTFQQSRAGWRSVGLIWRRCRLHGGFSISVRTGVQLPILAHACPCLSKCFARHSSSRLIDSCQDVLHLSNQALIMMLLAGFSPRRVIFET